MLTFIKEKATKITLLCSYGHMRMAVICLAITITSNSTVLKKCNFFLFIYLLFHTAMHDIKHKPYQKHGSPEYR